MAPGTNLGNPCFFQNLSILWPTLKRLTNHRDILMNEEWKELRRPWAKSWGNLISNDQAEDNEPAKEIKGVPREVGGKSRVWCHRGKRRNCFKRDVVVFSICQSCSMKNISMGKKKGVYSQIQWEILD